MTSTDIRAAARATPNPPAMHPLDAELPALRERLLRQARFVVHDTSLAEDLVQDTLIVVLQKHEGRRGEASLSTWANAILKHKVADWYRSPQQRRMVQISAEDGKLDGALDALYNANGAYAAPVPAWPTPDDRLQRRQIMTILERCIACLPGQTGRLFMMREWLGFETTEICERPGLSAANHPPVPRPHGAARVHAARLARYECQTMKVMHSCKKDAELLSQRMDAPLGWLDSLRLRMHLSMCGNSSNVEDQLACVRSATSDLFAADTSAEDEAPPSNRGVSATG